jgi:hypothetical protein
MNRTFFSKYSGTGCLWLLGLILLMSVIAVCAESGTQNNNSTVVTGNTESEVIQIMGNPKGKMAQGCGAVWFYGNSEVVFQNGKVTSVKSVAARPSPAPVPTTAVPVSLTKTQPVKHARTTAVNENKTVTTVPSQEDDLPPAAKGLKNMWDVSNGESRSKIDCTFGMPSLSPQALEAQKQKGMIPYRITATVIVSPPPGTTDMNKWVLVRTGPCLLRLFNEQGTEVLTVTSQADKLCPS